MGTASRTCNSCKRPVPHDAAFCPNCGAATPGRVGIEDLPDEFEQRLTAALADRYTVGRELGRSGMATVHLALDLKHDRHVAVKVMLPELAATDAHLWAEKYSGTLEDVFDLQEQLSRRIVETLKVTLAPDEERHLAGRDIPDVEAYALYLRARQELQKLTQASFGLAERLVERALARTGPKALLLATAAETLDRADALATQALDLDPELAEAHVAKGLVAWRRFDIAVTVRHVLKAVDLDPGNAMAAWAAGYVLALVGRTGEAREHSDRAYALDPLWWPAPFGCCLADLCEGNFDSALTRMVGMHTVSGGHPAADLWLGVCLVHAGRSADAAAPLHRAAAAGAGTYSASATILGAMVKGDREAMRGVLADPGTREAVETDKEFSWQVAAAFAGVGDGDEALRWLSGAGPRLRLPLPSSPQ